MTEAYPTIVAVGGYLPKDRVTNEDLVYNRSNLYEVGINDARPITPEWIEERTGIRERRWAHKHETTSYMATAAGRQALEMADMEASALDEIFVATLTGNYRTPSTAIEVHGLLGAGIECESLDLGAACAGSVAGLRHAAATQTAGYAASSLVIGSERMRRVVNNDDRKTSILFGDGAGALLVQPRRESIQPHFASFSISDTQAIYIPRGGTFEPIEFADEKFDNLVMDGRKVSSYATTQMPRHTLRLARNAGIGCGKKVDWDKVDRIVFHQANLRLIEAAAEELDIPEEKMVITVEEHGNTSGASIPLAIWEAHRRGQFDGFKRTLAISIGAGLVGSLGYFGVDLPKALAD